MLSWAGSLAVLGLAAWLVQHTLTGLAWHAVAAAWGRLSARQVAASIACTALSFGILALFDVLAARTAVPGRVSAARAAFAGAR